MERQDRLYALFGYETQGGRKSLLWDTPQLFSRPGGQGGKMLDEDYHEWCKTKGVFTEAEITQGEWIKEGDHGHSFRVRFFSDGRFTENALNNPSDTWDGSWQLERGILQTTVGPYQLDVFAKKDSDVHSGVEVKDHRSHAYFRVTHRRDDYPAKPGITRLPSSPLQDSHSEYLEWCNPTNDDERMAQTALDGLLKMYEWDGMPRIKAVVSDKFGYKGSFKSRKVGEQYIDVLPGQSPSDLIASLKRDLISAWFDYKGIDEPLWGPNFLRKFQEIS